MLTTIFRRAVFSTAYLLQKSRRCISAALLLTLPLLSVASSEPLVIGYIAGFKNMTQTIDATDLSRLTHINLSFTNPDANNKMVAGERMTCMPGPTGENVSVKDVRYVIQKAQKAGVKVLASVAGGVIPECSGDWNLLLQPSNREKLVESLVAFADDFGLDGLDVDIEGVLLTGIDQAGHYTPFIKSLSEALKKRNKLLTCATGSYEGGMVPVSSLPYFDFVNLMSYDAIGPDWGEPGIEHSSLAYAEAHIAIWQARGLPREKLVLGVPFYGYGYGSYNQDYEYSDLVAEFGSGVPDSDLVGKACAGCSYITYNGLKTIKAKTHLALEHGAGIMIWELSQDAAGNHSLLKGIHDEIALIRKH